MCEEVPIKIFLDDLRDCPVGYLLARDTEVCKTLLQHFNGKVCVLSLDNDLGEGLPEGRHLLNWLDEEIFHGRAVLPHQIVIHSANPAARDYMQAAIKSMYERYV